MLISGATRIAITRTANQWPQIINAINTKKSEPNGQMDVNARSDSYHNNLNSESISRGFEPDVTIHKTTAVSINQQQPTT